MQTSSEAPDISQSSSRGLVSFRRPTAEDGYVLNRLVAASPPLDPNSVYCNLLQCTHFRDTSLVAEQAGRLVGFVSGYVLPAQPDTLFIWQIVLDESVRGQGLARRMLHALLSRLSSQPVRFIETTITPGNESSWGLFRRFAEDLACDLNTRLLFERDRHFGGEHPDEELLRLGPLANSLASEPRN